MLYYGIIWWTSINQYPDFHFGLTNLRQLEKYPCVFMHLMRQQVIEDNGFTSKKLS